MALNLAAFEILFITIKILNSESVAYLKINYRSQLTL